LACQLLATGHNIVSDDVVVVPFIHHSVFDGIYYTEVIVFFPLGNFPVISVKVVIHKARHHKGACQLQHSDEIVTSMSNEQERIIIEITYYVPGM